MLTKMDEPRDELPAGLPAPAAADAAEMLSHADETPRPTVLGALIMATLGYLVSQLVVSVVFFAQLADVGLLRTREARSAAMLAFMGRPQSVLLMLSLSCLGLLLLLGIIRGFRLPEIRARYALHWPAVSGATFALALLGILALAVGTASFSVLLVRIHWLPPLPESTFGHAMRLALLNASLPVALLMAVASGLFPGVGEELLFRGQVQRGLLAHWSPRTSILVTSALFALWHVYPARLLTTFTFGCWVGWIAWRCDSTLPGMALHAINNCTFALVGLIARRLAHDPQLQMPIPGLLAGVVAGLPVAAICALSLARRLPVAPNYREVTPQAPGAAPVPTD
jgi:membrane protease YdiL (CAAX protease family)